MKFILGGLGNWHSDWETTKKVVPVAEELGYWAAVMPDHYMWGPTRGGDSTVETWVALTYLAAKTEKISLGTLVTPIPFRPPSMLAKMVSTLDVISEGRAILGVGAGWSQTEFEGYSVWDETKVRVDKTKEGVELIQRLWTEDKVTHSGRFYHAKNAVLDPKPVQRPHPPLLFGGFSRRMFRLAGKYADICYIPPWVELRYEVQSDSWVNVLFWKGESSVIEEARKIVVDEATRHSREDRIAFAAGAPAMRRFSDGYDSKTYADKVEDAAGKKNEYFVVPFPQESYLQSMKDFASNIMPSF